VLEIGISNPSFSHPPSRRCVTPVILRSIAFSVWSKRGRRLRHPQQLALDAGAMARSIEKA